VITTGTSPEATPFVESGMADSEPPSCRGPRNRAAKLRFKVFANGRYIGVGSPSFGFVKADDVPENSFALMESHGTYLTFKISIFCVILKV
jgi:hypothetical protein